MSDLWIFNVITASHYLSSFPLQGNWSQILVKFNAKTKGGKNTATTSSYNGEENGAREASVPCTHILSSFLCVQLYLKVYPSYKFIPCPVLQMGISTGCLVHMFQVMYRV